MVFLDAIQGMLSITMLSCVGYFVAHKGWVSRSTEIFLPRFITLLVLPPFLMSSMALNFRRDQLVHLIQGSLMPFATIVTTFLLFLLLARLFRVNQRHRYLFAVAACTSNTLFIGLPVTIALFGDAAIPFTLLYFMGNTTFFWTIGNTCIGLEGMHNRSSSIWKTLGCIFSPPLLGMLAGVALVMLEIPIPKVLGDACRHLGNLTTPLALIFVGIVLQRIRWREIRMGRDLVIALVGRFAVSPLVIILYMSFGLIDFAPLERDVFIIQSGLPCMTNIALISAYYGADREFGSVIVALSTICAVLTVPVWRTLIAM